MFVGVGCGGSWEIVWINWVFRVDHLLFIGQEQSFSGFIVRSDKMDWTRWRWCTSRSHGLTYFVVAALVDQLVQHVILPSEDGICYLHLGLLVADVRTSFNYGDVLPWCGQWVYEYSAEVHWRRLSLWLLHSAHFRIEKTRLRVFLCIPIRLRLKFTECFG